MEGGEKTMEQEKIHTKSEKSKYFFSERFYKLLLNLNLALENAYSFLFEISLNFMS